MQEARLRDARTLLNQRELDELPNCSPERFLELCTEANYRLLALEEMCARERRYECEDER